MTPALYSQQIAYLYYIASVVICYRKAFLRSTIDYTIQAQTSEHWLLEVRDSGAGGASGARGTNDGLTANFS